jgi:hypothetical protein
LFERQLSPLGRFFITVLRGDENSYLRLAEKWVSNVGIGKRYQHVFLEPFRQAYLLGRPEVQAKISELWSELRLSDIEPLASKFPFNLQADSVVSPSDVATVLHPQQGTFWKAFELFLSPVCRETGGILRERTCILGSLKLPGEMLNTINNITRLSKINPPPSASIKGQHGRSSSWNGGRNNPPLLDSSSESHPKLPVLTKPSLLQNRIGVFIDC